MYSSTILAKSKNIINSYQDLFLGGNVPNFIKEIPEFGKCVYYIERNPNDKTLIFKTKCVERWERAKESIKEIINILTLNQPDIQIEFEPIDNMNEDVIKLDNSENYYANILISGGVDSICGANYYVNKLKKKIIFSHTFHKNTPSIKTIRDYVIDILKMPLSIIEGQFKSEAKFRNLSGNSSETEMNLTQTRSFLYLCNAIVVNYAYGVDKIFITENGPLTINPPFTETSTFTNTTNPEFIEFFNHFLDEYFNIKKFITVSLPFRQYTKAELMASAPNELLCKTHSCSRYYNHKKSCNQCYACYVRRLSAYAYENYDDDSYTPVDLILKRYPEKKPNFFTWNDLSFFKKNVNAQFLLDLIQFCKNIINRKPNFRLKYPRVMNKFRLIGDRELYYKDFFNLLERFCLDLMAGFHKLFQNNRRFQNDSYIVWQTYSHAINELIALKVLTPNFHEDVKNRILQTSRSITGDISK